MEISTQRTGRKEEHASLTCYPNLMFTDVEAPSLLVVFVLISTVLDPLAEAFTVRPSSETEALDSPS